MAKRRTSISRKFSGGPYSSSNDCERASGSDCIVTLVSGRDLVEEMAQEGSDEAGLGLRAANHGPDGLARTCRPLRQPSFDRQLTYYNLLD
jgi:hypothetical protein